MKKTTLVDPLRKSFTYIAYLFCCSYASSMIRQLKYAYAVQKLAIGTRRDALSIEIPLETLRDSRHRACFLNDSQHLSYKHSCW